ncbi:MAG: ISAs1 family transposase, partial [Anaerolineales bacterium]|nr:ISAs1 family transposase [Anaerolineales bacterium]
MAKLAGEDKPSAIAQWIRLRGDAFINIFECKHKRMPCLNTIRIILQDVVPIEELETLFRRYLHETYGGQESQLIAIDGKTMRGTIPKGDTQGVHLLAAYIPAEGVVLKQVMVDTKENEISAAPELLKDINLKNKVICADAMQTQRKLSVDVLAKGGDYIWFLKNNQATLK